MLEDLRCALIEGEESGRTDYSLSGLIEELDKEQCDAAGSGDDGEYYP